MIVCINCKTETKTKMDELISNDNYKDYSELIAVAIDNLYMMEHEIAKKGALVIGEFNEPSVAPTIPKLIDKTRPLNPRKITRAPLPKKRPTKTTPKAFVSAPTHIPELFLANDLEDFSVRTTNIPANGEFIESFTLDRWLFGQYNKLLPVKANCRALLRITANCPNGGTLDNIAKQIGEAAALLGEFLVNHDRNHQIGRDDTLATAFPQSGPDSEKSRARYANQFVGSVNSQGVLSGLLRDYNMAALTPGESTNLMLTEQAVLFAKLINPVLDSCQTEPTQKFSSEEITFLLNHIHTHVPVETFTFRTLISAIANGAITPEKLDEALRDYIPEDTNRSLSQSFLTSQRSGALSRMADLGLIVRERNGVRVSYIVSELGYRFSNSLI